MAARFEPCAWRTGTLARLFILKLRVLYEIDYANLICVDSLSSLAYIFAHLSESTDSRSSFFEN